ncbi:hypothetical protein QYF36_000832 [Acer negundo]|nr:hypothetical protein QYF36_000832 [Acer negundo]
MRRQVDEQENNQYTSVLSISSFCGLFLATLEIWGISDHSALVTGGILCAAISFASKDVFENFLNGLWLRFLEPYKLEDYIVVKFKKSDGKVMDIRLISITIIDKKTRAHVVVPYTSLSQKIISNVSRATRVVVEENLRYHSRTLGISDHSALVTDDILGTVISFTSKNEFKNFLNGLWLRFLEPYKLGDYIVVKSEKLDRKDISDHSAFVTGSILGVVISFASKDVFENFLNELWLRFLKPYKLGDYIVMKSEKLDRKVMAIRLILITIINKKTRAHVVVPYTSLSLNIISNVSLATRVVVDEKFTIPFKDLDKFDSIINSSNQMLRLDFSADDYCKLSGVGEYGIELTLFCRLIKMDNNIGEVHVRTIRQSILINIARIILSSGATIEIKDKKKKNEDD